MALKHGVISPNRKRVRHWAANGDVVTLNASMKYGSFRERQEVLIAIRDFNVTAAKHLIVKSLNDSVALVALTAADVLENLEIDEGLHTSITEIRAFWKEKQDQRQENFMRKIALSKGALWTERHQRPSNKTLENVKQMLKKPMNIGKWM